MRFEERLRIAESARMDLERVRSNSEGWSETSVNGSTCNGSSRSQMPERS